MAIASPSRSSFGPSFFCQAQNHMEHTLKAENGENHISKKIDIKHKTQEEPVRSNSTSCLRHSNCAASSAPSRHDPGPPTTQDVPRQCLHQDRPPRYYHLHNCGADWSRSVGRMGSKTPRTHLNGHNFPVRIQFSAKFFFRGAESHGAHPERRKQRIPHFKKNK